MTIEGAYAEIAKLEAENIKLKKKCDNCEKVIAALGSDIGILNGLVGNVSAASSAISNVNTGSAAGYAAYSNGAFYMGQGAEEGNSQSFENLEDVGSNLDSSIQSITSAIDEDISQAEQNISIAEAKLAEYQNKMTANQARIDDLYSWIEEERKRQEEEESSE